MSPGRSAIPDDTTPEAWARYVELVSAQRPTERLAVAASLSRATREVAIAGIRARHPRATPREIQYHLARRLYGREIAERLFGPLE